MALCGGLNSAIQLGFNQYKWVSILVEGENKIVIQALEGRIHIPWQIHNITKGIRTWKDQDIQIIIIVCLERQTW